MIKGCRRSHLLFFFFFSHVSNNDKQCSFKPTTQTANTRSDSTAGLAQTVFTALTRASNDTVVLLHLFQRFFLGPSEHLMWWLYARGGSEHFVSSSSLLFFGRNQPRWPCHFFRVPYPRDSGVWAVAIRSPNLGD